MLERNFIPMSSSGNSCSSFSFEIDGSTREVWASLAAVQQRLRAPAALAEVKSKYQSRFGAPLEPALFPAGWLAR